MAITDISPATVTYDDAHSWLTPGFLRPDNVPDFTFKDTGIDMTFHNRSFLRYWDFSCTPLNITNGVTYADGRFYIPTAVISFNFEEDGLDYNVELYGINWVINIIVAYTATGAITDISPDTITYSNGEFVVPLEVTEFSFKDDGVEYITLHSNGVWEFSEIEEEIFAEKSSTNLYTQSTDMTVGGTVHSDVSIAAEDVMGYNGVDIRMDDNQRGYPGSSGYAMQANVTGTTGNTGDHFTMSFYLKRTDPATHELRLRTGPGGDYMAISLADNTFTVDGGFSTINIASGHVYDLGDGLFFIEYTLVCMADGVNVGQNFVISPFAFAGKVAISAAQIEAGKYSTSRIITNGSTLERGETNPVITDFLNQNGFIAGWVEMVADFATDNKQPCIWSIGDNAATTESYMLFDTNTDTLHFQIAGSTGGSNSVDVSGLFPEDLSKFKIGFVLYWDNDNLNIHVFNEYWQVASGGGSHAINTFNPNIQIGQYLGSATALNTYVRVHKLISGVKTSFTQGEATNVLRLLAEGFVDTYGLDLPSHPRLLLEQNEEAVLLQLLIDQPSWVNYNDYIIAQADTYIPLDPPTDPHPSTVTIGSANVVIQRVFALCYAYRMTGDEKYSTRAIDEMLAVAGFNNWDPTHALTYCEMSFGLSIGYDWLYDLISVGDRATIREAIYSKAIIHEYTIASGAIKSRMNQNLVCTSGMIMGALAIHEDYPAIAEKLIKKMLVLLPLGLSVYDDEGAWFEGHNYWNYGSSFIAVALMALNKVWNLRFDYYATQEPRINYMKEGNYGLHMIGPTGVAMSWSTTAGGIRLRPQMFWMAEKNNDLSIAYVDKTQFIDKNSYLLDQWQRLLPSAIIFAKDINLASVTAPTDLVYVAPGRTTLWGIPSAPMNYSPMFIARTAWGDENALCLGIKFGTPSSGKGQQDVGAFIVEADGVRWSDDLSARSILVVDSEAQINAGYAVIEESSKASAFPYVISDIIQLYSASLAAVKRGAAMVDGGYFVIRDEITNNGSQSTVRWQMLTEASVNISGQEATLTLGGETLILRVDTPASVTLQTWAVSGDQKLVGFDTVVGVDESVTLQVSLIPDSFTGTADFNQSLSDWSEV